MFSVFCPSVYRGGLSHAALGIHHINNALGQGRKRLPSRKKDKPGRIRQEGNHGPFCLGRIGQ